MSWDKDIDMEDKVRVLERFLKAVCGCLEDSRVQYRKLENVVELRIEDVDVDSMVEIIYSLEMNDIDVSFFPKGRVLANGEIDGYVVAILSFKPLYWRRTIEKNREVLLKKIERYWRRAIELEKRVRELEEAIEKNREE